MKHKRLILTTAVFFLLVNTAYFWEDAAGMFYLILIATLCLTFLLLVVIGMVQLGKAIGEKYKNGQRLGGTIFLSGLLVLNLSFPKGLTNFERFEGKDLLVAWSEGALNCTTTIKLKENNKFTKKDICFVVNVTRGEYLISHDTVYFKNVKPGRYEDNFFKFGIIHKEKYKGKMLNRLICYKEYSDTIGYPMMIAKNELTK